MSGLIVGLVLRQPITEEFNSDAKFIATVYADHAWEDGTHAYPAVDTVAKITGYSDRTIQRYLRVLEGIGMLILNGKGPRGTNRYDFPLQSNNDGSVRLAIKGGDSLSPRQPDGVTGNRVTSPSGDTGDTRIPVTQTNNPSLDLVINADFAKISKLYEHEIGALTPLIADAIRDACTTYEVDWIPEAITIAVQNNARRWSYVEAILKNCKAAGKRPSLNHRSENKHVNNTSSPRRRAEPKGQAPAADTQYNAADLAAAQRVKAKRKPAAQVS